MRLSLPAPFSSEHPIFTSPGIKGSVFPACFTGISVFALVVGDYFYFAV